MLMAFAYAVPMRHTEPSRSSRPVKHPDRDPRYHHRPDPLAHALTVAPIRYDRDDHRKTAVLTITGQLDLSDLLSCLERHRAAGAWTYPLLYDVRAMTTAPSMENLRLLACSTRQGLTEPARGRVAILASDPMIYGRACTYAAMADVGTAVQVFRDRKEAETWLARPA